SPELTFALTVTRIGIDGIDDTRNALVDRTTGKVIYDFENPYARIEPSLVKEISNQDWAVYLSAAKVYSDNLSYGINVKLISRSIGEYSAFGIGFDLGALYKYDENLTFGLCAQDVTTTLVAWSTGRNELVSPTVKAGTAYNMTVMNGKLRITPAIDLDVRFENRNYATQMHVGPVSIDPHAGVELTYSNVFAIRAGYNDVKQMTVGAGIKLPKLNIDYTFARFAASEEDRLDDSHRISLMLTLEELRFARK
ncbi:MAG: type IX secretion system membrane protein PorP/SprF, partial [Ignavibacteriales bacterium]|nr:type IX secretion system membrane protein PorP/SprF [Ignavibacteriales bacterium]